MSSSDFLRKNINQHSIKNGKSKKLESTMSNAITLTISLLSSKYPQLEFYHEPQMFLKDIIITLSIQFPEHAREFAHVHDKSFIKPDGGFLFAKNPSGERRLIMVAEVKRQGTNDKRKEEGLPQQARGNAIERLGKNLIGIKTIFKNEGILPFVCFGSGNDFEEHSTIRDRVITMNEFFPLNTLFVKKDHLPFEPVSLFFRPSDWELDDMVKIMSEVCEKSIQYRFI